MVMSLYTRKRMARQIAEAKDRPLIAVADYYEQELLDAASEDNSDIALGRLCVLSANLLELVRKSDPAYGLLPVRTTMAYLEDKAEGQHIGVNTDEH